MGVSPTEGKISTGRIGGGVKRASNKESVTRLPRGPRSEVSVKRVRDPSASRARLRRNRASRFSVSLMEHVEMIIELRPYETP
jgi:hypothetical protein